MELRVVTEDLEFPEGPVAMADGSVIVTEIKGQRLTRVTPDGAKTVVAETGGGPNGAAVGPDGAIYVTNNGGLSFIERNGLTLNGPLPLESNTGGYVQRVDLKTGAVTTLYESCDGKKFVGLNDLVFDRTGGFWFTDYGGSIAEGRRFGALYYARADGSKVVRARGNLISPNGVGLSPDEEVVYVADTILSRLWAFDVAAPGELGPRPGIAPGRVVCNLQGHQQLDSLAVEAGGAVCVATLLNGGITTFRLNGSTEHVPVPDLGTTNICFGGADMRDAWITGSSTGRLFKCRWPRPGLRLNFNA